MRLQLLILKYKKWNLVLINNVTHQRETLSERPIRLPLNTFNTTGYDYSKVGYCTRYRHLIEQN